MNFTACVAGMPEDNSLWNSLMLMRYLFLLGLMDCISGQMVIRVTNRSKPFYLPRSGYRDWCRLALWKSSISVLLLIGIVFLFSLWRSEDSVATMVIAVGVFALNIITLTSVQTLLLLNFSSGFGFVPLMFIQVLSLFVSYHLPGAWKLLLPGNWGMIMRSTLSVAEGYPLTAAIGMELLLLLFLWTEGWRLVRWHDRKDRKI